MVYKDSTDEELHKAMAHLRTIAKGKAAIELTRALQKYVAENAGQLPDSALELEKFLPARIDPKVLERYEVIRRGGTNDLKLAEAVLQERAHPENKFDTRYNISLLGAGYSTPPGAPETFGFSFSADDWPADEPRN
jgi:hypothetical protein